MAAPTAFASLCQELSRIHVQILQRHGSAVSLSAEAVKLLHGNLDVIHATAANAPYVPLYLKTCAALFHHSPPQLNLEAYEVLEATSRVAFQYVGSRYGDVNDSSSVLRSVMALEKSHTAIVASAAEDGLASEEAMAAAATGAPVERNPFAAIVQPAHSTAYEKWLQQRTQPTTLSVLSLISGTSAVYGKSFHFPPTSHDIRGLLPCKSRVLMEAKLQRCHGARELLTFLRGMDFNRLDAGMSLNTMAEAGFYNEEVCNKSCSTLHAAHALVTSQQLCEVLYSLGVLQHRHVHMKFFASLVDAKRCDARAVLKQTVGLAMLQQPPPQQRHFMDGLFLHALRSSPRAERSRDGQGPRTSDAGDAAAKLYQLPPSWFLDAAHALSCLGIHHVKFKLMTARHTRNCIARLSTSDRCKLLYALGGVRREDVPAELQRSWQMKVEPVQRILYEKLKEISPEDGPQVVNALHYCGVSDHPSIPKMPNLASRMENPADVILQTWSRTSKERILQLTEQLQPHHLRQDQPSKVVQVVTRVADSVGPATEQNCYRFGPLVAAVDASGTGMSTEETIRTINALQRMDLAAHYRPSLEALVDNLWSRRTTMTADELVACAQAVGRLAHLEHAPQLMEYCSSCVSKRA